MKRKSILLFTLLIVFISACAPSPEAVPVTAQLPTVTPTAAAAAPEANAPPAEPNATAVPTAQPQPSQTPHASELISEEMLANMSFNADFTNEGTVKLKNGRFRVQAGSPSDMDTVVSLSDDVSFGSLNGRPVAAAVLVSDEGDDDQAYSLHVVGLEAGEPTELASSLLTDAAQIDTVIIASDQIAVELVAAGPRDASCCPTQLVVQLYRLLGNELVRTTNEVVGTVPASTPAEDIVKQTVTNGDAWVTENEALQVEERAEAETGDEPQADGETTVATGSETAVESEDETDSDTETAAAAALDIELAEGVQPGSVLELLDREISLESPGLAGNFEWRARPARTSPQETGGWIYPGHLMITFDGENLLDVLENNGRRLLVFPLHEYLDFGQANGQSEVGRQVARLQTLIDGAGTRQSAPEGGMPLLPPPNSLVQEWSRFDDLDFVDGRGVRYMNDSDGSVYTYQGLSGDGRYYISLWWPLDDTAGEPDLAPLDAMVKTLAIGQS